MIKFSHAELGRGVRALEEGFADLQAASNASSHRPTDSFTVSSSYGRTCAILQSLNQ